MVSLEPATSITLTDVVERKIYEYISRNNLKEGDCLPKEQDLADSLNVSRHILREALSRLRMVGLIDSRKKKGMTISSPNGFIGLERMISSGVIDTVSKKELLEMRIIIEIGIADYIFRNKTDQDIRELEDIIKKETEKNVSMNEIDIRFHSRLYEIAGNKLIQHFQGILESFFSEVDYYIAGKQREGSVSHADICKVLKNGTAEDFRKIIHKHLSQYI